VQINLRFSIGREKLLKIFSIAAAGRRPPMPAIAALFDTNARRQIYSAATKDRE
jgi:hypothetical protein